MFPVLKSWCVRDGARDGGNVCRCRSVRWWTVWAEHCGASRETRMTYKYLLEDAGLLDKYEEESEVSYDYGKMVMLMWSELMCVNTVHEDANGSVRPAKIIQIL